MYHLPTHKKETLRVIANHKARMNSKSGGTSWSLQLKWSADLLLWFMTQKGEIFNWYGYYEYEVTPEGVIKQLPDEIPF
jgi:hypothetical protein